MKAIIVEDEQLAADRLNSLVSQADESIEVIAQFDTVRETVSFLESNGGEVDLLFCDIQLADGLSFNIFDKVTFDAPVIFTTAYDEYTLKAFKVNSLDYLLKPVRLEDLDQAIKKYKNILKQRNFVIDTERLKQYLESPRKYRERFLVRNGTKFFNKAVGDITYFSTENRIVYLHDEQPGKKYITEFTLDELMRDLLDPDQFFRINRQMIVNIEAIELMKAYSNQRLILQLQSGQIDELIVSREKVQEFKKWFEK